MKIWIGLYYDGFDITVDNKRFYFSDYENLEQLEQIFRLVNPDADITCEEVY